MAKTPEQSNSESFDHLGIWWLPDAPEKDIGGRLIFEPGEWLRLELTGAFEESQEESQFETVFGHTQDGHVCTLFGYMHSNVNVNVPGYRAQTLIFTYLIVGQHLDVTKPIAFSEYQIAYASLNEWIGKQTLTSTWKQDPQGRNEASAQYREPEVEPLHLSSVSARVEFGYGMKLQNARQFAAIRSESVLRLVPDLPQEIDSLNALAFDLERLLILLMGHVTKPNRLLVRVPDDNGQAVAIFRSNNDTAVDDVDRTKMMLTYSDVQEEAEAVFDRWCVLFDEMRPVLDIFFATIYQDYMYLEVKFLTLTQALDGFHRQQKQNLKRKGKISFMTRLNELLASLPPSLQSQIHSDAETFFNDVVITRDYYAHYIPQKSSMRLDSWDLWDASERLRMFMTLLLLQELGLEEVLIEKAATRLEEHVLRIPSRLKDEVAKSSDQMTPVNNDS